MKCPNCRQHYTPGDQGSTTITCSHCFCKFDVKDSLNETFEEIWTRIKATQASWPKRTMREMPVKPRP